MKEAGKNKSVYDIVVFGAGFSGSFTIDQLLKISFPGKIALIESEGQALGEKSSSANECFKLHTGIHYVGDEQTAIHCLKSSVMMAHHFSECILDSDNPSAPTRRGRHYLMSNSHFGIDHTKKICELLKYRYKEFSIKYPKAKKIFGEPENFITYLEPKEYPYVAQDISFHHPVGGVSRESVVLGIETPECQIDITKFRSYFQQAFDAQAENLDLLFSYKVLSIQYNPENLLYRIKARSIDPESGSSIEKWILSRCVINCTWNNIELFVS